MATASCAWCAGRKDDPRWPDCDCRTLCAALQCLPGFPAADVTPGMAVHHPHGSGVLDVIAGPDAAGFMYLTGIGETVRVAADWPVTPYTREDADLTAFLLLAEGARS